LKIVDYFDNLKNKIDLLVEIFINDNQHDQVCIDEINKAREEWVKESDECQAYNLTELEENENQDEPIADEQLFKRSCFIIHLNVDFQTTGCFTGRFISTDMYLRPGQIECFQELLKFKFDYDYKQMTDKETLRISLFKIFSSVGIDDEVLKWIIFIRFLIE
jgi:hypothetical protein